MLQVARQEFFITVHEGMDSILACSVLKINWLLTRGRHDIENSTSSMSRWAPFIAVSRPFCHSSYYVKISTGRTFVNLEMTRASMR